LRYFGISFALEPSPTGLCGVSTPAEVGCETG
jgi:hypothetical protein